MPAPPAFPSPDPTCPGTPKKVRGRADLEVGLPAVEGGRLQLVPDLGQLETGARVSGPAGPDEVWHEPGAQRLLEGQCHGAGLGLDELAGGGHPVVELVGQRVDVPLENRARVSHLRRPARPAQQRRAGFRLHAPQSSTAPFERAPARAPSRDAAIGGHDLVSGRVGPIGMASAWNRYGWRL